jgi:hypothetical protein
MVKLDEIVIIVRFTGALFGFTGILSGHHKTIVVIREVRIAF